jgi:hypothetical protein
MAATIEPPDVVEVLAWMRPGLDELGDDWPAAQRQAVLEGVLAQPGGRSRRARWVVEGAAAAAAVAAAVFLIPGVWDTARTVPAAPASSTAASASSAPVSPLTCRKLNDRERNDVGVMNQTYHGVSPDDGVVASAEVDAGGGYRVIGARLTTGQVTAWLAWDTDFSTTSNGETSYVLHLAEIKSLTSWDGGTTPYGRAALAAVLPCVS